MKELTEEESLRVSENHNLIYWYAHRKGLNLDEWYGLLAIELCKAVRKHDRSRGGLANYYKMRADLVVYRTVNKKYKEGVIDSYVLDDEYIGDEDVKELLDIDDLFPDETDATIVRMRLDGYTHQEIGDEIGFSRQYVSVKLKEIGDKIADDRQSD